MPTITIDIAGDTLTCIAALAAQRNRTVSEIIAQALSDYIVRKAQRGDAPENRTSYTQYHRTYRERHREQYNAYMRAWGKRNRARRAQYNSTYRERHREQYNAYMRAWGKRNGARLAQYNRTYRERHREQYNAYIRAWGKRNRARLAEKKKTI